MNKLIMQASVLGLLAMSGAAHATITGYTNNPNSNRQDWIAAVGSYTTNIDFDAANNGASYTATSGFLSSGFLGDGNNTSATLNNGQGQHPDSNYFRIGSPGGSTQTFTVTFASLVGGAGVDVIDWFGADGVTNSLTLSAYTGAGGTGTLLGTITGFNQNYQNNNVYFFGLTSSAVDIGSIVFTRISDNTGDTLGLDNIVSSGGTVPEPVTWGLMIAGFGMVGLKARRARQSLAA